MGVSLSKKKPPKFLVTPDTDERSTAGSIVNNEESEAASFSPSFTTAGNYAIDTFNEVPFDVYFVRFDKLKAFGKFPSLADDMLTPYRSIVDRDPALTIFVSHSWFRGLPEVEGKDSSLIIMNKPDNAKNVKYQLCINGINSLLKSFAPNTKDSETFIWFDYSCLKFHNEISDLDRIMECCDCLFTPIYETEAELESHGGGASSDVHQKSLSINSYNEYEALLWNGPSPEAYLNRAWCRLEILYAAIIPLGRLKPGPTKVDTQSNRNKNAQGGGIKRKPAPRKPSSSSIDGETGRELNRKVMEHNEFVRKMFLGNLRFHISHGRRPHVLYGSREMVRNEPAVILPPLQTVFFDKYAPAGGVVTIPRDMKLINKLLDELKPHMHTVERGYRGDLNSAGEMHGYGVFRYANGDVYEGQWRHDKKCGIGIMKYPHHGFYSGEFREDVPWGKGSYHLENGDVYEGEVRKGLYHSLGSGEPSSLVFANGDKYLGEFKDGRMTGQGTFWHNSGKKAGDVYEGELFEDFRQGKGTYTAADGSVYTGDWFANRKHGFGKQIYAGGSSYEGEFRDGHKHGKGKFFYTSGDVYEGYYKRGKMDGHGKFTYITGASFEGTFKDDLKHGPGIIRHINGDYFEGTWKEDRKVSGIYRHQNGSIFTPNAKDQETF